MKRPLLIAITGDIAAGKSTLSQYIRGCGYLVHNSDEVVHMLLKQAPVIEELKKAIAGDFVFYSKDLSTVEIDRAKLRNIVFADTEKLNALNNILHPRVLASIQREIDKSASSDAHYVFFEIPLLFECSLQKAFDLNILLTANYETKINRIIERDKCSIDTAKDIIDRQMPQTQKEEKADIVLQNDGDVATLHAKLDMLLQTFKYIKKRNIKRVCINT